MSESKYIYMYRTTNKQYYPSPSFLKGERGPKFQRRGDGRGGWRVQYFVVVQWG